MGTFAFDSNGNPIGKDKFDDQVRESDGISELQFVSGQSDLRNKFKGYA